MVNRAAAILRYLDPVVDWINDADPINDDPATAIADTNDERTIYLISDEEADNLEDFEKWLKLNYQGLFEAEIEGWYADEFLWPATGEPLCHISDNDKSTEQK